MASILTVFSSAIWLPAIAGFIPALFWLWFWLREDRKNPEPKLAILGVFIAGIVCTAIALPLQQRIPGLLDGSASNPSFLILFFWAMTEELAKYIAAAYVALTSSYFDEPVDAMVYMLTAALGFAALENSLFLYQAFHTGGALKVFLTTNNRFLGATLLHVVSSVIAGGTLALAFYKKPTQRILYTVVGLIIASVLHALFNFFIIRETAGDTFSVLLILWLSVIALFLFFEKIKHLTKPR